MSDIAENPGPPLTAEWGEGVERPALAFFRGRSPHTLTF